MTALSPLGAGSPEADELEKKLTALLPPDGEGVAVQVSQNGEVVFRQAFGLADRESQRPATLETPFRIGSVTKQFTAAAILRLADDGKLSLDDSLSAFFSKFPGGKTITLRHLLNQTSGLANYTARADFTSRVTQAINPAKLIRRFESDPPDFAPGTRFAYSNTNYFLLGEIVAQVSGLSLGDFLKKEFFDPLGMKTTGIFLNADPPLGVARGYGFADGTYQPAIDWDMSWAGGAGAMYSTVGDLCLWTEALHGGRVLKPASLQAMLAVPEFAEKPDGLEMRYGFGLYHSEIGQLPAIGHNGGLHGWLSQLVWFPDHKLAVAVLTNALPAPPGGTPAEIVPIAARAFLGKAMAENAPQLDPTVERTTYADFVGSYDYGTGIQEITTDGGRLFGQLTGQKRFEVFPSGPDTFFYQVADAQMQFERDAKGSVVAIRHIQNGASFRAPRLTTVAVPEKVLDEIVGSYNYGPSAVLTITRTGSQLGAQLTGQPEFPIFPESETVFVWKVVPARIEIQREKDGKISGVKHTQNGTTFFAPRQPTEPQ